MDNKFVRYLTVEPRCRTRIAVFVALVALICAQNWYKGALTRKVTDLNARGTLIVQIPKLEKDLKRLAQLEAFRNQTDNANQSVTFTKISGIAMGDSPSVLIDDTVYSEGDAFGDYVIEKITPEIITLINKKTNARKNLYVFESE